MKNINQMRKVTKTTKESTVEKEAPAMWKATPAPGVRGGGWDHEVDVISHLCLWRVGHVEDRTPCGGDCMGRGSRSPPAAERWAGYGAQEADIHAADTVVLQATRCSRTP